MCTRYDSRIHGDDSHELGDAGLFRLSCYFVSAPVAPDVFLSMNGANLCLPAESCGLVTGLDDPDWDLWTWMWVGG
jgi:hypothetical protein